jgi:hypothetical protein
VQLQPATVRQLLLALIQQNCVAVYLQPAEVTVSGTKPAVYLYEADLDAILQGPRYGLFWAMAD